MPYNRGLVELGLRLAELERRRPGSRLPRQEPSDGTLREREAWRNGFFEGMFWGLVFAIAAVVLIGRYDLLPLR